MSKTTKKVVLSIVGVVLLICGGLGVGVYYFAKGNITPQTYQQIQTGDTQDEVRKLTGGDATFAREAVRDRQPAPPADTTCDYVLAEGLETVYRFCFKDGKLAQKDEIPAT